MGGGGIQILEHSPAKNVKYIHFLDSDDWFELDCIEECVKSVIETHSEIVWHNYLIYDDTKREMLGIKKDLFKDFLSSNIYSPLEIFTQWSYETFSWAWCGMYAFESEMKKLRFVENIESEDAPFGLMLFLLAKQIYILDKGLAVYRIRENSISQHTLNRKDFIPKWPEHMQDIVQAFEGNHQEIRLYHFDYSHCIMCIELEKFFLTLHLDNHMKQLVKKIMKPRISLAFGSCTFRVDPRGCRSLCKQLASHTSSLPLKLKIAFYFPNLYQFFKKIKTYIKKPK